MRTICYIVLFAFPSERLSINSFIINL